MKAANSPTDMRRSDRAVEDESWIKAFLRGRSVGILATAENAQPFINSNLFLYDESSHAVYIHTARSGRTRETVEQNPQVCFHVYEMGRLLPADEALEFSVEYAGVTIFGACEILIDPIEKEHALQLLLDKYAPHLKPERDYRPISPDELKRTAVFKINIEQWSAKRKVEEPNFPGAFRIEEPSFL